MIQRDFLIGILLLVHTISSEEITVEQVSSDLAVCQEVLSNVSLQLQHFSFLLGLIDSLPQNASVDTFNSNLKKREEFYLLSLEDLSERGIYLQKQVNNLNGSYCSPCIKSGLGHFSKKINTLQNEIKQSMAEVENVILQKAALFSVHHIQGISKKVAEDLAKNNAPEDAQKIGADLERIKKQFAKNNKDAVKLLIETIRLVFNK